MSIREDLVRHLRRLLHEPRSELTRWQLAARAMIELGMLGANQLRQDRAPQMAAALAFRTLFGLVPTLVVATILVRALGGFAEFEAMLAERLGGLEAEAGPPAAAGGETAATVDGSTSVQLVEWILSLVDAVESINLAAITWVGLLVLAYSAVSLMVTIENCFNAIRRAPGGRSWLRRLPVYWTVLCLAPALLALAQYVDGSVDGFLASTLPAGGMLLRMAAVAWSIALTTLALALVYRLVPSVAPPMRHAVVGAFVATIGIEAAWRLFGAYIEHALSLRQLTGSLGLLPLFMFWVYLLWLVILFGLEVATILERRQGRALESMRAAPTPSVVDPAAILLVAGAIAARFRDGRSVGTGELAEATGLPATAVETFIERLVAEGVVHRVAADGDPVAFSRAPETVSAGDLLVLGHQAFGSGAAEGPIAGILERLRAAERDAAEGVTAASLGAVTVRPAV